MYGHCYYMHIYTAAFVSLSPVRCDAAALASLGPVRCDTAPSASLSPVACSLSVELAQKRAQLQKLKNEKLEPYLTSQLTVTKP